MCPKLMRERYLRLLKRKDLKKSDARYFKSIVKLYKKRYKERELDWREDIPIQPRRT